MLIQIDKLKRRPRQIDIDEQAADFAVLQELIGQGSVSFDESIHGSLEATWAGDVIEVSGQLETTLSMPCARCLTPVPDRLVVPVLLCYTARDAEGDASAEEELELESDELGLIAFSGPEIDLRPDLEQEIVMALPLQPLCDAGCKGLCPVCGGNLNLASCNCEPPVFHAGLAALKNFKVKK